MTGRCGGIIDTVRRITTAPGFLAVALVALSCSTPPTAPSGPILVYATTVPGPASATPFALEVIPDAVWTGMDRQSGNLAGPIVPNVTYWKVTVRATGNTAGSVKRIEHTLRDRQSGATLGSLIESGPFYVFGNSPVRAVDGLKTHGNQTFTYNLDMGFVGRSADLQTTVVVEATTGATWTLERTTPWELLMPPTPTHPVNVVVKQNDPASGCPFDPVHGYGLVLDLRWTPPAVLPPNGTYLFSVLDGRGTDLTPNGYSVAATSYRLPLCGMHIAPGAERSARFGVRSSHAPSYAVSAYQVATFDFQPCREAGVPACQ